MEQKGWECPRCHTVYAPWVEKCTCKGSQPLQYQYTLCPRCGGAFPTGQSHECPNGEDARKLI